MKTFEELVRVNYCYSDCAPLMNIIRLSEAEAFQLAHKPAKTHPDTTAFYRFANFNNHYTSKKQRVYYKIL